MKTKSVLIMFLSAALAPLAFAGSDPSNEGKSQHRRVYVQRSQDSSNGQSDGQQDPHNTPPVPDVAPDDPSQASPDYGAAMLGVTQRFSEILAEIAKAVDDGKLSNEDGKSLSIEAYEKAQMQFELLGTLRALGQSAATPDTQDDNAPSGSDSSAPSGSSEDGPGMQHQQHVLKTTFSIPRKQINSVPIQYVRVTQLQTPSAQQVKGSEMNRLRKLIDGNFSVNRSFDSKQRNNLYGYTQP
jgi:hypothetical protein